MQKREVNLFPIHARTKTLAIPIAACAAAIVGLTLTRSIFLGILLAALPAAFLVLTAPVGRAVVLVLGFLFVFQSSDAITAPKLGVFLFYTILFLVGSKHVSQRDPYQRFLRLGTSAAFCILFSSLGVSLLHNTPALDWLRDVLPYFMVAMAPTVGLEIGAALTHRAVETIFAATTIVSSLLTFLYWAEARHIVTYQFGKLGLASFVLPLAGICWGIARQRNQSPSLLWTVTIAVSMSALALSGTRTNILAIPAILYAATARSSSRRRTQPRSRRRRLFVRGAVIAGTALSLNFAVSPDWSAISSRFAKIGNTSELSKDQSALGRQRQTAAAFQLFKENYIVGVGPGRRIASYSDSNNSDKSYTVDSPAGVLADFGIASVLLYIAFAVCIYGATALGSVSRAARKAFFLLVAVNSLLISPLEDKGASLALVLLAASSNAVCNARLLRGPVGKVKLHPTGGLSVASGLSHAGGRPRHAQANSSSYVGENCPPPDEDRNGS